MRGTAARPAARVLSLCAAAAATVASLADARSVQTAAASTRVMRVPIVKQRLRNNCETAALSMLLAGHGVHVDQLTLQRELPRSGPLDPIIPRSGGLPIWGDPDRGFVGRAAGGGTSGGYGVYQAPIRALAARHGVALTDLTGRPAGLLYRSLRSGHPVLAWVALSNGPYKAWRTASGKVIRANFGEHAVVLTGINDGSITLNDPLSGRRMSWTRSSFERMWLRLGRRALSS